MESKTYNGRYLKRNHRSTVPRYIVALDTETRPYQDHERHNRLYHRFRLGCAIAGCYRDGVIGSKRRLLFVQPQVFWEWFYGHVSARHTTWLVAHNLLFDLVTVGFHDEFVQSRLVLDIPRSKRPKTDSDAEENKWQGLCVLESPPTIIGMRHIKTGGRIVAVDTLNYFRAPLSDLGKNLGLEKLPMPSLDTDDNAWFEYCERDTEIVFQTVVKLMDWIKQNDMGNMRYTAAGQAMAAYRHKHMKHKICFHDQAEVKALERRAFFGGRIECFRLGKISEVVYQLDVNSLFPWAMAYYQHPCKLLRYDIRPDYLEIMPSIDWGTSIAEVKLKTHRACYPQRNPGCTFYPIGTFHTTLCGSELAEAIFNREVIAVKSWAEYETADLFSSFVLDLWNMRVGYKAEGNALYDQFAKSIINSLYGKWAQQSNAWQPVASNLSVEPWSTWSVDDRVNRVTRQFRSIGYSAFENTGKKELSNTFVAISAFVSSAARNRMQQLLYTADWRNVYYIGVDGLIVNARGMQNLENAGQLQPNEIGKLREIATADDCEIIGCADYRIGTKVVIAGRSGHLQSIESGEMLSRHFYTLDQLFSPAHYDEVLEETTPWQRSGQYPKGVVLPNGIVTPFHLDEPTPANDSPSRGTLAAASANSASVNA